MDINQIKSPSKSEIDLLFYHYQYGPYDIAENMAISITKIYPNHQFGWKILGDLFIKKGCLSEGLVANQKAVELAPKDAEAHYNLGVTLQKIDQLELAEASYKIVIALKLDYDEAYINLGVILQELGKLDQAEANYKRLIKSKPNFPQAHNNLGNTLKELGRLEEAEKSYNKAIALKPDYSEAHNNLGAFLLENDRLEEAETCFNKAIMFQPNYAEAFLNLSTAFLFLDKLNETTQALHNTITTDPNNYGLKAGVFLAILNFLNNNLSSTRSLLLNSARILNDKKSDFKNDISYWIFLSALLDSQQAKFEEKIDNKDFQKLYVIGESNSLASHGIYIELMQNQYLCQSFWILGCKQWHLGNPLDNKYKYKFQKIIQTIPYGSKIMLSIGEIDCRINEGILNHIKKYPNKDISSLITSTIINYLNYINKVMAPYSFKITIQGVPCPNINFNSNNDKDIFNLIKLIQEFNFILKKQALFFGFNFLDLHKLTDRGDGFSNAKWHLDQYHLSPIGMQEAWRSCFIPSS
jgi:Flp pilus assembly protein TadD